MQQYAVKYADYDAARYHVDTCGVVVVPHNGHAPKVLYIGVREMEGCAPMYAPRCIVRNRE
jgi:hypothetical protein